MTNEEAFKNMDQIEEVIIHSLGGYPYTEEEEFLLVALGKARTALEKQIPKKPLVKNPSAALPTMVFKCPVCKCELDDVAPNSYCPECGQSICWEE